jgi:hypothetical protein
VSTIAPLVGSLGGEASFAAVPAGITVTQKGRGMLRDYLEAAKGESCRVLLSERL